MKKYVLLPKVFLRSPLLPLTTVLNECFDVSSLAESYKNPVILEALYLASPTLFDECKKWLANQISDANEVKRIEIALAKYLIRMSCRSTPFGLFAGFSLVKWATETNLVEQGPLGGKRHTRLDMFYLCALAERISRLDDLKNSIKFFPNSTLYDHNTALRYFESKRAGEELRYEIAEVPVTDYLLQVIELSKHGVYLRELVKLLADNDASEEDAVEYINELINGQILVSELQPKITGPEFIYQILSLLAEVRSRTQSPELLATIDTLGAVFKALNQIDLKPIGDSIEDYKGIAKELEKLGVPIDEKRLFQVDLLKSYGAATLDNRIAGQVRRAVEALNKICPNYPMENLTRFSQAFLDRYESREMPLLQVLDNESGIGYGRSPMDSDVTPLVDDIPVPLGHPNMQAHSPANRHFLHGKYLEAIKNNSFEVEIIESDLNLDTGELPELPDSFSVIGEVINLSKGSSKALICIKSAGGLVSAASLLGRFTHADKSIDDFVLSITKQEQEQNNKRILAEIVHLPQSRIGNILLRTRLRDYEIPFLANSSVDEAYQIPLQDILVSVNSGGQVVLRSKRLNKEVIPRLATAHNYSYNALPIYQFLGDLQFQHMRSGLSFNWEATGIVYPFKPRLKYSNIILSRASWRFIRSDLSPLLEEANDGRFAEWREKWHIPRYISLIEHDNELPIDLANDLHLMVFKDYIRNRPETNFFEFLVEPDNCILKDEWERPFSHEFVIGFIKQPPDNEKVISTAELLSENEQTKERFFSAGDEWLYFKVYAGLKSTEELLTNHFPQLLEKLVLDGLIGNWFFVRYADPESHLRIRFHLKDTEYAGRVISLINERVHKFLETGFITKIQIDTYVRELERYGEHSIELVERLYGIQSDLILKFLASLGEEPNQEVLRLFMALKYLDLLLSNFGLDLAKKHETTKRALNDYYKEFNVNSFTKKQLSAKYSGLKETILSLFGTQEKLPKEWLLVNAILDSGSLKSKELVDKIAMNVERHRADQYSMIWSIFHMFVNKLIRSKQRKHELLFYFLITRYYEFLQYKNSTL